MTWFLIIIAVIALLIYLINRDKKEILTNRTSKRGPLNERYSIIVNELLKEPGTNIVSESTEKIRILAVKDDSSIEIEIHEMYSEFIIRLNIKKDSLQVMSKAWKFSLNIDQRQVLSKIEKEVNSELDRIENLLPIVDKNFFSESVREVDLVTGERGIGQVEVSFFEVSENNLKIDEDTTVPWKYQGQQGQDSIFKDETGNIWELNDESLSLIIIEENKKIIYTKVKN